MTEKRKPLPKPPLSERLMGLGLLGGVGGGGLGALTNVLAHLDQKPPQDYSNIIDFVAKMKKRAEPLSDEATIGDVLERFKTPTLANPKSETSLAKFLLQKGLKGGAIGAAIGAPFMMAAYRNYKPQAYRENPDSMDLKDMYWKD